MIARGCIGTDKHLIRPARGLPPQPANLILVADVSRRPRPNLWRRLREDGNDACPVHATGRTLGGRRDNSPPWDRSTPTSIIGQAGCVSAFTELNSR